MGKNKYAHLDKFPMGPGFCRDLIGYQEGENGYTVNRLYGEKGANTPPHAHPHLQFVYVLSGSGLFKCADEEIHVEAGDYIQIGSNVPHCFARVDEDCSWLEFFTPCREDFKP